MRSRFDQADPPNVVVEEEPEPLPEQGFLGRLWALVKRLPFAFPGWIKEQAIEHPYAVFAAVYGLARAMGVTVQSGNQGLLFSFGRAREVLEPGFRFLIPFLQVVRIAPTRHRTLDLSDQKVTTLDGLVYRVHATLVWRIVDIRRALIEIGNLEQGMRDALAISVWEVLRERERGGLRVSEEVDAELARKMEVWLEPWGVVVERAGFQSIAPSPRTLTLIQLRERVAERERTARLIAQGTADLDGTSGGAAIALVGLQTFPRRRQRRALRREIAARYRRRVALLHGGLVRFNTREGRLKGRELAKAKVAAKKKARLVADRGMKGPWSTSTQA